MNIVLKNKKKKRIINDLLIMLFISGLILFLIVDKNYIVVRISENRKYAIATITNYKGPSSSYVPKGATLHNGSSLFISFYDSISNSKVDAVAFLESIPHDPQNQIGKQFIVVYNYKEPKDCILLSDYPVKDSMDYVQYIEAFKKDQPNLKGYRASGSRKR